MSLHLTSAATFVPFPAFFFSPSSYYPDCPPDPKCRRLAANCQGEHLTVAELDFRFKKNKPPYVHVSRDWLATIPKEELVGEEKKKAKRKNRGTKRRGEMLNKEERLRGGRKMQMSVCGCVCKCVSTHARERTRDLTKRKGGRRGI